MNTRTFLLQVLAPFTVCFLGTLALASPLLPREHVATHSPKVTTVERRPMERTTASRVAHSNLPSVVEQLDQIHDNYAQDVQDEAVEYRMRMTGASVAQDQQYPPPKPSVDFTEEQEAAIEAGQDPWGK